MPVAPYTDRDAHVSHEDQGFRGVVLGMCQPMKALPPPNMNAKPHAQCKSPHTHVSNTHSTSIPTVSRLRTHAGFEHGETRLHAEHEERAEQKPTSC